MRPSGSYEMNQRQLRALVMLLVLLPLIPTAFVVRFLVEAIYNEHLESRERIKPVYQEFLAASNSTLAAAILRQMPTTEMMDAAAQGKRPIFASEVADAVLKIAPDGTLSRLTQNPLAPHEEQVGGGSERLVASLVGSGARYVGTPLSGSVRWHFLSETPEPVFALRPAARLGPGDPPILLIKTRRHLLDVIGTFYSKVLDPQGALRVIDENGDQVSLVGPVETSSGDALAETMLPPPLPAWRVQLFSVDTAFIDGIARQQITFSAWAVGGMVVVTGTIAGIAGLHLRRRIAMQEMRNDILAVVSHEMKTPLASSRMFIDTLLERRYHGGPDRADEYLRLIAQENLRLERLAESFLTLSRLDGQRGHGGGLKLAPTQVDTIIDTVIERLRPRLEAPGCHFELIEPGKPLTFSADAEALTTVLVNLLENALKYTGDKKHISLRAHVENEQLCFEISDNGQGIDPDEQGRIFERFYQSDRRLARAHDGCGLGLSLVQSIVRAHGGTVSVQSALGSGSVFTVRLPLKEPMDSSLRKPLAFSGAATS